MAVDDLLIKLAKNFPKAKQQTVFLINNYDMTIAVLKVGICKLTLHFFSRAISSSIKSQGCYVMMGLQLRYAVERRGRIRVDWEMSWEV